MEYSVYNKTTGKVTRSGNCPPNDFIKLKQYLPDDEDIIDQIVCDQTKKIVNNRVVDIPQEDILAKKYELKKYLIPKINSNLSDTEIDQQITDFFLGCLPDLEQWKIDNYSVIRKQMYPDIIEFLDAQVKLSSGDKELEALGKQQLEEYIQKCVQVKTKYPKVKKV